MKDFREDFHAHGCLLLMIPNTVCNKINMEVGAPIPNQVKAANDR
jgi:hypothetical protein